MLLPQCLALLPYQRIQLFVHRDRHDRVVGVKSLRLAFLRCKDTTVSYWLSCRGVDGFEPVASGTAEHAAPVAVDAPLQVFLYLLRCGIYQVVQALVE